jgi:hypothetical protein
MSQQYQKQKEKWFNAGKSQATKEILEEEIRFCQELWDKAEEYTCDGWVLILVSNKMKELRQQLKKLGEGK